MKYVLIALGAVVVAVAILAGLFFVLTREKEPVSSPNQAQSPFGFIGGTATTPTKTLSLSLRDGTVVQAHDFTKQDQPEWAGGASGYLVGGGEQENFIILYFAPDVPNGQGEFLVNVNAEPIGDARRRAEAALKARLEMTEEELCKLAVSVRTAPGVSSTYGGYDLGLSFCPGAVALP
jgi:hypothetical protein